MSYPIDKIRNDFPILKQKIGKNDLVYLDNGATSQKPISVIQSIYDYYTTTNANIHRGVHTLSQIATDQFENSRKVIKDYFDLSEDTELIFTSGTTESINLVAHSFGSTLEEDDEIIFTESEHHSNIVPWQLLAEKKKMVLKYIPSKADGSLDIEQLVGLISSKTKLLSIAHISNAMGIIHPLEKIIPPLKSRGIKILVDGAQSVPHCKIDIEKWGIDFFAFSAHKMYGPTGIGGLIASRDLLNSLPPYKGGGDMIKEVEMASTKYAEVPYRFEAGTPNISAAIAFSKAVEYIQDLGLENIVKYEKTLLDYATDKLCKIKGLKIFGDANHKAPVVSFVIEGIHAYDIGSILDQQGIAVRTGHHCAQPLMKSLGIEGTVRASFALYNTIEEIDKLESGIQKAVKMLS